jgi:hypothetical protein
MPQYTEPPANMTPFAQVLVDFMWNKRPRNTPPISYNQLAIRLDVPKQSVSNWILRGSVPPLDTIMVILARLHIPLRDLYDAYVQSDLPTPAWDAEEQARINADIEANGPLNDPVTPRKRKPAKAPILPTGTATNHPAPEPLPYTPPPPVPTVEEEWDRIVRNTERTLRNDGVSEQAIAAVISDIRRQQRGEQTPIQRSLIAEHTEPTEPAGSTETIASESTKPEPTARPRGKQNATRQPARQ